MNKRLGIFIFVFAAMNLIFIPLLSLYGLRVCPVLTIPGFGFGCIYSSAYIFTTNILSALFIFTVRLNNKKTNSVSRWIEENRAAAYALIYFFATALALTLLMILLDLNHLSVHSRAPEVLILASFLLGITQAYGLNWALHDNQRIETTENLPTFRKLWASHIFRTMLPLILVAVVLLHFLIRQSVELNTGHVAAASSHDELIEQTSYIIVFLLAWLLMTFTFHFLSERDHVEKVQTHLDRLHKLDFKFRSNSGEAWGLWAAIIHQLNSFSKILGERARLLKTFSKFVTAEVAEQALHQELKAKFGVEKDLTVIVTDIRNFTALSEKLRPNDVVTLLNEYFTAMLDVISGYQISIDKFIGDGILAYVEPEATDKSEANTENQLAVEASLAMIKRLDELNLKLIKMQLPAVKIGIGIYRGPLVIGLIGSEAKLQHTIIGDTVNKTSRLEGLCKELGVQMVISQQVWQSLASEKKDFFRSYGKQTVKGITELVDVFGGPI